jgi:hypothetical protein
MRAIGVVCYRVACGTAAGVLASLVVFYWPRSAPGFIDTFRPETLGGTCERVQSITVLRVIRFDKKQHVIVYEVVKDLKGWFPRDLLRQIARDANEPHEMKHLMDWVGAGKTAVAFRYENRVAICTGDQWSVCDQAPPKEAKEPYTLNGTRTEPLYNGVYFGDADKLVGAVKDILAGKETVVPVMLGRRDKELRQRTGKVVQVRASLKRQDYNLGRDQVEAARGQLMRRDLLARRQVERTRLSGTAGG